MTLLSQYFHKNAVTFFLIFCLVQINLICIFIYLNTYLSINQTNKSVVNKCEIFQNPISVSAPEQGGLFTPQQCQIMNSNVSYQGYLDQSFIGDCSFPANHNEYFDLMKIWIDIAGNNNITWWLISGSLIGSWKFKDMIPWDSDIDIGVPSKFMNLIHNISTDRKDISANKTSIITRPGPHCPRNGMRLDCNGNPVHALVDGCSFCGPFARVFHDHRKRIDIFLSYLEIHDNQLKVSGEEMFNDDLIKRSIPIEWNFPLHQCPFMGLTVPCPKDLEKIINFQYGHFKYDQLCINGTWKNNL